MVGVSSLAPYAVSDLNSRGRQYEAEPSHDRSNFQRDYARVLHSRAFRRLQGKTQVFSASEGDLFRTRMSHSMEVEQLSRRIANQLNLNEDLCATLAIGHDIGHPPFGHMGQDVLNDLMKNHGGFEHNHQALRLVDKIEVAYTGHDGLNLMFETREGLLKHCSADRARTLGDVAARHLTHTSPPLEVQVVDKADAIAYLHADLEDAFVRKLLTMSDLREAPGFMEAWGRIKTKPNQAFQDLPTDDDFKPPSTAENQRWARATVQTVLREMMSSSMADLIRTTRTNLTRENPQSLEDVRQLPELVQFSNAHAIQHRALKRFSRSRIYEHPSVAVVRANQAQALRELFAAYIADPTQMSGRGPEWGELPEVHAMNSQRNASQEVLYRVVADHVAGMTDSYALAEHRRLKDQLAAQATPPPASPSMTGKHEALRQRVMAVYEPFATQAATPSAPINALREHITALVEDDPSLLDELPTWIEGLTPGSKAAAILIAFQGDALFRMLGPCLSHMVPTMANLNHPGFWGDHDLNARVPHWGKVCPPAVLRWWVCPPGTVFENEEIERTLHREAVIRTREIYKECTKGHPWFTPDRLWHDPDWRRVMLDGLRPSPTDPNGGEARQLAAALNAGLSHWTPDERAAVTADPLFPTWEARWLAVPVTAAVWRAHQAGAPEAPSDRPRMRRRS